MCIVTAGAAFKEEHKRLQCKGRRAQRRQGQGRQKWPSVAWRQKPACGEEVQSEEPWEMRLRSLKGRVRGPCGLEGSVGSGSVS